MSLKRNMIVVLVSLLTFAGFFVAVRHCDAGQQQEQTPAKAEVDKTQEEAKAELLGAMAEQLKDLVKAQDGAKTLSQKIQLSRQVKNLQNAIEMLQEPKAADSAEKPEPAVSYVQVAAEEFSNLVPVYSGNEVEKPAGFGKVLAWGLTQAAVEEREEVKAVKTAVLNRLQEAHTRAVLGQENLHVPEYTALLNKAPRNEAVLETIQQDRLEDEMAIEGLVNPSFWQQLEWWWNS